MKAKQSKSRLYAILAMGLLSTSAVLGIAFSVLQNAPPAAPRRLFVEVWNPLTNHTATGFIAVETVDPQTSHVYEEIPLNASLGIGFSQGNYTVGQTWGFVAFTNQCVSFSGNACAQFQSYYFGTQTIKPYAYDPDFYVVQLVLNSTEAAGH